MDLIHFPDRVHKKLKDNNISLNELAKRINVSRPGLYKMLDNIPSINLDVFLNICEELNIEPIEFIGDKNSIWTADHIIDFKQTKNLKELLKVNLINVEEASVFLGYEKNELEALIDKNQLDASSIYKICAFYKFPVQLFYKEQYKTDYKGIKANDYIKHQKMLETSNNYIKYLYELDKIKTEIIDIINSTLCKKEHINVENFDYQELVHSNMEYSSFQVSIFAENCNIPTVLISNNPNHILSTQQNIEILIQNVYGKFFRSLGKKIGDIIWIELTYSSNDSININFVKSESDTEFTNPQWLTIKGYNDRNIKIEPKRVKEFLNME